MKTVDEIIEWIDTTKKGLIDPFNKGITQEDCFLDPLELIQYNLLDELKNFIKGE